MDKKTEQLHKANGSFDFVAITLINPYDGITLAHNYFPNDFLCDI